MKLYGRRIAEKVSMSAAFVAILVLLVVLVGYIARPELTGASASQVDAPQVTLNPGGGILANGTDGLRFTINSDENSSAPNYNASNAGQDGVVYRGTRQYCCSAGAPMLNIGGTIYGQAGPAIGATDWSSIQVIATTGVASTGDRTGNTGNSGATIRYTVDDNGLTYAMDRTVSYVYPNDYVTDSYSFVIPATNAAAVKFYLGGDTAPGSSDQGYGIMLTSPVRSVISLNTSSHIMFGFREVQGSRAFDGATSQDFYEPFPIAQNGGDIGFVGTASNHDAGLMMQWNLGATPGTYTGSLQQFATQQGTNLTAAFAESYTASGNPVDLNLSIVNSELDPVSGLGYTLTLPAGLLIDSAAASNCGGTLTAVTGTNTITISSVSLSGASNCVVTVPVVANNPGAYIVTDGSVTSLIGALTSNIGSTALNVGVRALSFATQGGDSISDMAVEQGSTVVLSAATRAGYTFDGWNAAPDGSGTAYAAGANFIMPSSDTTLYARWQVALYSLTFEEQGGDAVSDVTGLLAGDTVTLPSVPARDGYDFIEWNVAADASGESYEENGDFTISAGNATLYAIWEDNDGIAMETENAAPNNGDANNDGELDSQQASVGSFVNAVTGKPTTLAVESAGNDCFLSNMAAVPSASLASDPDFTYPLGLLDFAVDCGTDGFTATVKQYFYDAPIGSFMLRKFINSQYQTVSGATFNTLEIDGRQVLVASYEIADGGPLDADGTENGIVIDPAGPGVANALPGVPNTGVKPGMTLLYAAAGLLGLILAGLGIIGLLKLRETRA